MRLKNISVEESRLLAYMRFYAFYVLFVLCMPFCV